MKFDDVKMENLLKEWITFRDESLSKLSEEDSRHPLDFDDFYDVVSNNVSNHNRKFMVKKLDEFYNRIMSFTGYYNDKYYMAWFGDCLNLVIGCLGKCEGE